MSGVAGQTAEVLTGPRFSDRGRLLTAAALAVFIVASVAVVAAGQLFLSREVVFIWILVGLFAVSLSDINGFLRGVLTDWLPFFGALFVYDLLRGRARGLAVHAPTRCPRSASMSSSSAARCRPSGCRSGSSIPRRCSGTTSPPGPST